MVRAKQVTAVAVAPDSKEAAATGDAVRRWALPGGESLGVWGEAPEEDQEPWEPTGPLTYSPDGNTIAVVCAGTEYRTNCVLLRERQTGRTRLVIAADFGATGVTRAIAFSPDGTLIACLDGPVVAVANARTGETVAALRPGPRYFTGCAFAPDGKRLIAVNNDAAVRVYDTANWNELTGYEWQIGRLTAVAIAPDGLRAACGSAKGQVVVWDLE